MDKNRIMMIIIIALLVILLGTIGFVSFYAINLLGKTNVEGNPGSVEGSEQPAEDAAAVLTQDQIITVYYSDAVKGIFKDMDKTHGLTFKISIGIDNSDKKKKKEVEELKTLLEERDGVVKSFVNEIIYNHTHEDYNNNSETMPSVLAGEILERLQLEFGSNLLIAVYVSEYLYQ